MYNDIYEEKEKPTMEISLIQGMLISITVLVTLIIPMQVITQSRIPTTPDGVYTAQAIRERESGQVAGIETEAGENISPASLPDSDTRTITFPIINKTIDLSTETGTLILTGTILIIFALMLLIYSIISSSQPKKRKR